MIAMAIANEPDILIADEPTTALDVTIQAHILDLLKDLRDRFGMALLLITHDLTIVRKMADRVSIMTRGEIVETGPTVDIFSRPSHPYTRRLLAAEPKGRAAPADPAAPELMAAEDVKVWFPIRRGVLRRVGGYVKAVDGVSLAVRSGMTLGVVGESGSGKTTLGLALLRLTEADGHIRFAERDIAGLRQRPHHTPPGICATLARPRGSHHSGFGATARGRHSSFGPVAARRRGFARCAGATDSREGRGQSALR